MKRPNQQLGTTTNARAQAMAHRESGTLDTELLAYSDPGFTLAYLTGLGAPSITTTTISGDDHDVLVHDAMSDAIATIHPRGAS